MIVAVTGAAILAAALAAAVMTPMYRAEVVLAPVTANEDSGRYSPQLERFSGIAALAGVNLSQHSSRKNEALATLESRLLTEQFIEEEALLPVLFHDLWDQEQGDWKVADPDDQPTLWDAYELFDKDVRRISEDKRSGLVVLSIEWDDPVLAAHWGNELVRRVNEMLRERTAQESEKAIGFLQQQLKQVSAVELEQVLHRLIESRLVPVEDAQIALRPRRGFEPASIRRDPGASGNPGFHAGRLPRREDPGRSDSLRRSCHLDIDRVSDR